MASGHEWLDKILKAFGQDLLDSTMMMNLVLFLAERRSLSDLCLEHVRFQLIHQPAELLNFSCTSLGQDPDDFSHTE